MKTLLVLLFASYLAACTSVQVAPSGNIDSRLPSKITLTDTEEIKIDGFVLKDDQIIFYDGRQRVSIPRQDVSSIETVDRMALAKQTATAGVVVGGIAGVYSLIEVFSSYPEWAIVIVPVTAIAVVGIGAVSGAVGYVVGERTHYNLNPLEINRQTDYSSQLFARQKNEPKAETWRGIHLGLNLGVANAFFPKISDSSYRLGQSKSAGAFLVKGELGAWVNQKIIIDSTWTSVSAYEERLNYSAYREVLLMGLQATYFPKKRGLFYKGGFNYGVYSETIEDITTLDGNGFGKTLFEKNDKAMGLNASVGTAFKVLGHLKLTTELSAQGYLLDNKKPTGLVAGTVGLHWY